jgi:riboflavin biosynthesis pyrimidine reductase
VLTEGGPHLLAEFVAAGLLDELCLTLSPHLLGSGSPRIVAGGSGTPGAPEHASVQSTPVRLAHLLEAEGNLFARYLR